MDCQSGRETTGSTCRQEMHASEVKMIHKCVQPSSIINLLVLSTLLVACSQTSSTAIPGETRPDVETPETSIPAATDTAPAPSSSEAYPSPATPEAAPVVAPGMERLVEIARADLAKRLNLSEEEIEVLEARSVVWPDASLGCPQPGMLYIQILMEGGLIRLSVQGIAYEYHAGESGEPFLCEHPGQEPVPFP